jgi:VIT1/CCC1 family predicted Fe2+/Mn2+ transporter
MPPPPPGGYPPPTAIGNNQKAIVSMVLGIISIFCCGFVLGIVAIVLGLIARKEIAASSGLQGGSGFAIAGIVTGVLGILGSVVLAFTGFYDGFTSSL